jgi:hypothetical protein
MALTLLGLGGVLGAVGQGARVIVGLKKDWEAASKDERMKELAAREEELRQKLKEVEAREKEAEKKLKDAKAVSGNTDNVAVVTARNDMSDVTKEKEALMTAEANVLTQRRERRWFSPAELLTSLLIATVIGAIAGVLAGISLVEAETGIDQKTMLTIAAAGYAGTDFIEGFMKSNMPK